MVLIWTHRELQNPANHPPSGPSFPIMAGVSGHSTAQVLEYISDASSAGADYILVLPPGYFGAPLSSPAMLHAFFRDVSLAAWDFGLPTVIYNFRTPLPPYPYPAYPMLTIASRRNKRNRPPLLPHHRPRPRKRPPHRRRQAHLRLRRQGHTPRGGASGGGVRRVWRAVGLPRRRAGCWRRGVYRGVCECFSEGCGGGL